MSSLIPEHGFISPVHAVLIAANGNILAVRCKFGAGSQISCAIVAEYTPDKLLSVPLNIIFLDPTAKMARATQFADEDTPQLAIMPPSAQIIAPRSNSAFSFADLLQSVDWQALQQLTAEFFLSFPIFVVGIDIFGALLVVQCDSAFDGSAASFRIIVQHGSHWHSTVQLVFIGSHSGETALATIATPQALQAPQTLQ